MEQVRMKRSFTYEVPGRPGVTRTVPAGWSGSLPDDVAAAAEDEGAAIVDRPEGKEKAAKPARGSGSGRGRRKAKAAASADATADAGDGAGGDAGDGEAGAGDAGAGDDAGDGDGS